MDQLYDTEPGQPRVPLRATPDGYLLVQVVGGGGGGGSSVTNLSATVSPTQVVVASDTGTDATIPLADTTNAGAMPPAAVLQLAGLGTASTAATGDFASAGHTHSLLMTTDERTKLGALPEAADLTTLLAGKMANTLPAMQTAFSAGTAPEKAAFQSSVSGYVGTLQDLFDISLPYQGQRASVISPVFSGGIPYTRWIYDGTAWRLDGPQDLLIDASPSVGTAATAEQLLKQTTAAAGLLPALRYFSIRTVVAKSGTTDAMSAYRIRFGANGTTTDFALFGDVTLTAPNRQRAVEFPLFATSPTVLRHYINGFGGGTVASLTPQAYPAIVTVASMLSQIKISFTAQMAGTTDTPTMVSVFISGC